MQSVRFLHGRRILLVCLVVWCSTGALSRAQTVLLEDNFDNENGGVGVINYAGFANFSVTAGSVDLIGNGFADFFPGNGLYVDLDGTTGAGGTLQSSFFNLQPGLVYTLQFDLGNSDDQFGGGSFDNTVTVSLSSQYSEQFNRDALTPFETITRQVTVATAEVASLTFVQEGGDDLGVLIDNIRLTVVPEPATFWLSLLSAVWLGWRRRSR